MTDNEIIKALECCGEYECKDGCPLKSTPHCIQVLKDNARHLINRQKAEIERLREGMYFERERVDNIPNLLRQAKSEAYKELAEKLYERIEQNSQFGFAYVTKKEIENVVRKL